jgi:hypothetical protein
MFSSNSSFKSFREINTNRLRSKEDIIKYKKRVNFLNVKKDEINLSLHELIRYQSNHISIYQRITVKVTKDNINFINQ